MPVQLNPRKTSLHYIYIFSPPTTYPSSSSAYFSLIATASIICNLVTSTRSRTGKRCVCVTEEGGGRREEFRSHRSLLEPVPGSGFQKQTCGTIPIVCSSLSSSPPVSPFFCHRIFSRLPGITTYRAPCMMRSEALDVGSL